MENGLCKGRGIPGLKESKRKQTWVSYCKCKCKKKKREQMVEIFLKFSIHFARKEERAMENDDDAGEMAIVDRTRMQ